jgi:hypothetical protein
MIIAPQERMNMCQEKPRAFARSRANTIKAILSAKHAATVLQLLHGRFEIYSFLKSIYLIHRSWKLKRIAKMSSRLLATEMGIVQRKGMSPIRVLIEATLPTANGKQKSRWVRALQYLSFEHVRPREFRKFIAANGGLAGCARLAARVDRKRSRPGGDWD